MSRHAIETRIQAAQDRLHAVLQSGGDTGAHREAIALLEADLANALGVEKVAEASAVEAMDTEVEERTAIIAGAVVANLAELGAKHIVPPNDDVKPADPAVVSATKALARAEAVLSREKAAHQAAADHVEVLQSRLADLHAAAQLISDQRRAGELTDREAAGMLGFNLEDQADLKTLITEAERKTLSLVPNLAMVDYARVVLDREVSFVEFQELKRRSHLLEKALIAAVAELFLVNIKLGNSPMLGECWIPSRELHEMMHFGVPPQVALGD